MAQLRRVLNLALPITHETACHFYFSTQTVDLLTQGFLLRECLVALLHQLPCLSLEFFKGGFVLLFMLFYLLTLLITA